MRGQFLVWLRPERLRIGLSGCAGAIGDENRAVLDAIGCILLPSGCQNGNPAGVHLDEEVASTTMLGDVKIELKGET